MQTRGPGKRRSIGRTETVSRSERDMFDTIRRANYPTVDVPTQPDIIAYLGRDPTAKKLTIDVQKRNRDGQEVA